MPLTAAPPADRPGAGATAGFNPYVHGARGVFSAMVFVFHVANSGLQTFAYPGSDWVHFYLLSFKFGVELFFGISGIVILGALGRARSLAFFAWDRCTRIYPVLWVTLVSLMLFYVATGVGLPSPHDVLLNFLIPPPWKAVPLLNPAAWSLTFEVAFYLLCALGWPFRRLPGAKALFVIGGLYLVALYPRTMLMLPGALIGIGLLRRSVLAPLARCPLAMTALFLLCWRVMEVIQGRNTATISIGAMPLQHWLLFAPGLIVTGLLGAAALLGIVDGRGRAVWVLQTRPVQWLGTISYSFYLWHPVVLAFIKRGTLTSGLVHGAGAGSQLLLFAIGLPCALLVAFVSQQLIERRFTRWLRRLVEPRAQAHAPLTATAPHGEALVP